MAEPAASAWMTGIDKDKIMQDEQEYQEGTVGNNW
jgi:hypothetical protein